MSLGSTMWKVGSYIAPTAIGIALGETYFPEMQILDYTAGAALGLASWSVAKLVFDHAPRDEPILLAGGTAAAISGVSAALMSLHPDSEYSFIESLVGGAGYGLVAGFILPASMDSVSEKVKQREV